MNRRSSLIAGAAFTACAALGHAGPAAAAARALRYFPSGPIYAYRWKLLALALGRDAQGGPVRLAPYEEDVTQNRGMLLLQSGAIDVVALGTNAARGQRYPHLALESTKALYFPYPVYFWVRRDNAALAARIERGLKLALADGSFRQLFEGEHATEIAALRREKRQLIRLDNPILPAGSAPPDTSWWWPESPPAPHASRR